MTLKQKELVSAAVLIAGLLLMLIGGESIWVLLLGLAVALGAVVFVILISNMANSPISYFAFMHLKECKRMSPCRALLGSGFSL